MKTKLFLIISVFLFGSFSFAMTSKKGIQSLHPTDKILVVDLIEPEVYVWFTRGDTINGRMLLHETHTTNASTKLKNAVRKRKRIVIGKIVGHDLGVQFNKVLMRDEVTIDSYYGIQLKNAEGSQSN